MAGPSREASIQRHEAAITELVFDLYELTLAERQLVHDMVEHGIEFFYWSQQKQRRLGKTMAVTPPDTDLLTTYAKTFSEVATSLLRYQGRALKATIYEDGAPLSVVGFELTSLSSAQEVHVIQDTDRLQEVLRHLDSKLLEQRTSTLYMRRHVHIYDGANLYLVRPSERRFWTRSQARVDADSIVAEWLSYSTTRGR